MRKYQELLYNVLSYGVEKSDRTGTGTKSLFGYQMRFDLSRGFPLLTTKRLHWHSIKHELLWFISGSTNANDLRKYGVTIWDEWAKENGSLGPIYGKQWRAWETKHHGPVLDRDGHEWWNPITIDQLREVVERIGTNPDCRRLIVSAWNPADIPDMALAPCHCLFQFYTQPLGVDERLGLLEQMVEHYELEDLVPGLRLMGKDEGTAAVHSALDGQGVPKRSLSCRLDQRSSDVFLGVPYNIASYALLTHMVARHHGMAVGDFIWQSGDTHLYLNHLDQVREQLGREPRALPTLRFSDDAPTDMFQIQGHHLLIDGYDPHPAIKAPVAV